MYTLFYNSTLPSHNTSKIDDKNCLKGGTANYLFEYNNSWYLVKSQYNYWSRSYHIHSLINKTTNNKIKILPIKDHTKTLNDFIQTICYVMNLKIDKIWPYRRNRNEWELYVIPIIKKHIDASGL